MLQISLNKTILGVGCPGKFKNLKGRFERIKTPGAQTRPISLYPFLKCASISTSCALSGYWWRGLRACVGRARLLGRQRQRWQSGGGEWWGVRGPWCNLPCTYQPPPTQRGMAAVSNHPNPVLLLLLLLLATHPGAKLFSKGAWCI